MACPDGTLRRVDARDVRASRPNSPLFRRLPACWTSTGFTPSSGKSVAAQCSSRLPVRAIGVCPLGYRLERPFEVAQTAPGPLEDAPLRQGERPGLRAAPHLVLAGRTTSVADRTSTCHTIPARRGHASRATFEPGCLSRPHTTEKQAPQAEWNDCPSGTIRAAPRGAACKRPLAARTVPPVVKELPCTCH